MDIPSLSDSIEKVSGLYASRFNINRDSSWFVLKLQEELGELTQSFLMLEGKARVKGKTESEIKKDFNKEVADVFCHTLLLAKFYNIDLETEVTNKWLTHINK